MLDMNCGHECYTCKRQWTHELCTITPRRGSPVECPSCTSAHKDIMEWNEDEWAYIGDEFTLWVEQVRKEAGL